MPIKDKPFYDFDGTYIRVKCDFMKGQFNENTKLRQLNEQIKERNFELSNQNEKLKQLCHLTLRMFIANGCQSSTTPWLCSSNGDKHNDHHKRKKEILNDHQGNDHQKRTSMVDSKGNKKLADHFSKDRLIDEKHLINIIDKLIDEYVKTELTDNSSPQLKVEHFNHFIERLMVAATGGSNIVNKSNDDKKFIAYNEDDVELNHNEQKLKSFKRKGSLINRFLSRAPFIHSRKDINNKLNDKANTKPIQVVNVHPASSMVSLANSAAAAAHHTRPCDSMQMMSDFFEVNQENQRMLVGAENDNSNGDGETNLKSPITNSYHLAVAPVKTMNSGIGSPTKSVMATEEHSGGQLSSHIHVEGIVDTSPKMSEIAMFCGLNDNGSSNQILNYAIRKENEKRREMESVNTKMKKVESIDEEQENDIDDEVRTSSPILHKIFSIGCDDNLGMENDVSGSVGDDSTSIETGDSGLEDSEMNLEQEMDRLLSHLHKHRWFVPLADANAAADIATQLEVTIFDLNNVEIAFQSIHRLWLNRKSSTTRVIFFYELLSFLFDKYINVLYCDCHQPPCAPNVESALFTSLAVPIIKQFLRCINPSGHIVMQIELLTAIESLVYNRQHYRPALPEVFHQLFTNGVIECVAFAEWGELSDPSSQFELNSSPLKDQREQLKEMPTKNRSKSSLCRTTSDNSSQSSASGQSVSSKGTSSENLPTIRERLFRELSKAGFRMFKSRTNMIN